MKFLAMIRKLAGTTTAQRLRVGVIVLSLLGGLGLMFATANEHYPVQEWLVWRYLLIWILTLYWSAGVLLAGAAVLHRVLPVRVRAGERLLFSAALGVLVFFLLSFVCGALRWYGTVYFFGLPLVMAAGGALALRRHFPRLRRLYTPRPRGFSALGGVLWAFGILASGLIYFSILHPHHVSYDARWYHLGIAEQYAAYGGIFRFDEGWFMGVYPHLASFIYSWAFLIPRSMLFDYVNLASHLEFAIFLLTLFGAAQLAQRLVPRFRLRGAWTASFLFPGLFLYDSSLLGGADHVAAFWAAPLGIALFFLHKAFSVRAWILVALMLAGAALTKYSAMCIIVPALLALMFFLVRVVVNMVRQRSWAKGIGPLAALGAGLLVTAPHWLKNWIWHGNPVFPIAYKVFGGHPWSPGFAHIYQKRWIAASWAPKGSLSERLEETSKAVFTFAFQPHDWPAFHGKVPVFGFIFTLLLLSLPFLRRASRIWLTVIGTHAGVFVWYWTQHEDRYLQIILPWMAASVAATLALLWREGKLVRIAASTLVGAHVLWGLDVPFIPTHAMLGTSPLSTSADLAASGYARRYKERLRVFASERAISEALPPAAKVILHERHLTLGLRRVVVSDWAGFQSGISYGHVGGRAAMYRFMQQLGVTHFVWAGTASYASDSVAGDLAFFDYVNFVAKPVIVVDGSHVAAQPDSAPGDVGDLVAYFGCGLDSYAHGLYPRSALNLSGYGPPEGTVLPTPVIPVSAESVTSLIAKAQFSSTGDCSPAGVGAALREFQHIATRNGNKLWSRRRAK